MSATMSVEEEAEHNILVRRRRQRGSAFYAAPPAAQAEGHGDERSVSEAVRLSRASAGRASTLPRRQADDSSGVSKPGDADNTLDEKIIRHSSRMAMGYADTIGRRPTMEDMLVCHGRYLNLDDCDYMAVFDGHGGAETSHFCAQHLHGHLAELLKLQSREADLNASARSCLVEAFMITQKKIEAQKVGGGATGIVALVTNDTLFVANAGDSRAVVATVRKHKSESIRRLSTDHKPDLPSEEQRIREAGGTVTKINAFNGRVIARVNGVLAVSRALGDVFLQPYVTAEPEVTEHRLRAGRGEQETLIVACDGLWDVLSDEEVFDLLDASQVHDDPRAAAELLRKAALERNSTDNISVVVAVLPRSNADDEAVSANTQTPATPSSPFGLRPVLLAAFGLVVYAGWTWWRGYGPT